MTMGLKRLDPEEWVLMDKNYLAFHKVRKRILEDVFLKRETLCYLDTEKLTGACFELLDLLTEFLATKYPQFFVIIEPFGRRAIYNKLTKELLHLEWPSIGLHPLEIAARLATEDFNIFLKHENQHIMYVLN